MKDVLVIGYGYVGQAYAGMLRRGEGRSLGAVHVHDPAKGLDVPSSVQRACAFAFVCVPTPSAWDGACDVSIVERAIRAIPLGPLVVIKSTVPPGTTRRLRVERDRPIIFSPECIGEGGYHVPPNFPHPTDPTSHGFLIAGGDPRHCAKLFDLLLPIMGPSTRTRMMASEEAEAVKYFLNAFLALKVTFANEMRQLCDALDIDYHSVREGWLDDPRIGASHSVAFSHRPGFDGKCLPKDTHALEAFARSIGLNMPLLSALIDTNGRART